LKEVFGDLWTIEADARCITTNAMTNSMGSAIMGKGIALAANNRYPDIAYKLGLALKMHGPQVEVVRIDETGAYLVVFPTKIDWKDPSPLWLIERSAKELIQLADDLKLEKVVCPRPGAKNGKRNYEKEVRPILEDLWDDRFTVIDLPPKSA
jgi:hypothetical protein